MEDLGASIQTIFPPPKNTLSLNGDKGRNKNNLGLLRFFRSHWSGKFAPGETKKTLVVQKGTFTKKVLFCATLQKEIIPISSFSNWSVSNCENCSNGVGGFGHCFNSFFFSQTFPFIFLLLLLLLHALMWESVGFPFLLPFFRSAEAEGGKRRRRRNALSCLLPSPPPSEAEYYVTHIFLFSLHFFSILRKQIYTARRPKPK